MVAIFTGLGAGLERGSGNVLGQAGLLGDPSLGRFGEQLFLNAATGNFLINQQDEFLVGLGPDASVSRTYNSRADAPDGDNWRQNTTRSTQVAAGFVYGAAGSTVDRIGADGAVITYSWQGPSTRYTGGIYVATDGTGAYDTLSRSGSVWTWTDGDSRTIEQYSAYGTNNWRITKLQDTDGNKLTYTYSGANLTAISTQNGESINYTWSDNKITEIRTSFVTPEPDALFAKVIYRMYDAAFDRTPDQGGFNSALAAIKNGLSINDFGNNIYASAEYQARGVGSMSNADYVEFLYQSVLRRASDSAGKSAYIDALNSGALTRGDALASFSESSEHVAVSATIPGRTAPSQSQVTRTRYGYDSSNRLTSVTVDLSPMDSSVADGLTHVTTYGYDAAGRVNAIGDPSGTLITIDYDASGRVQTLSQIAAAGATRVTTVDYASGYTTITDPAGNLTRLDYDGANRLIAITAPPATAGAAQQTVTFSYDANGDVLSVSDALGHATNYTYVESDGQNYGNIATATDPSGRIISRTYDAKNALVTETWAASDEISAEAAHTTRYVYDSENHLRYIIGALGDVTEYRYTGNGLSQYVIGYPEQRYDISGFGANSSPTETQVNAWRDALPDRSSIEITNNAYDLRGNVTATISYSSATTAGDKSSAEGYSRTYYSYDQFGELLSSYDQGYSAAYYVYDGLGRITASINPSGNATSIAFDDASGTTRVTLASGLIQTSTYNRAGELISSTDNAAPAATVSYKYDRLGRLRMATDATGAKTYTLYDHAQRKTADIADDGSVIEYRYDEGNRLIATIHYRYRLTPEQMAGLSDPDNTLEIAVLRPERPQLLINPIPGPSLDHWNWQIYDNSDRLVESITGDGSVSVFDYDAAGQLITTTTYAQTLTAAQLTAIKETPPATKILPVIDVARDSVTRTFYDAENRLVGTMNALGNVTRNVHDGVGRVVQTIAYANATTATNRSTATFQSILSGVAASTNDSSAHSVYDGQGQLRYTVDPLNQVVEYTYGRGGQQLAKIAYAGSIGETDYTYDSVKSVVEASGLANNSATRTTFFAYNAAGQLAYAIDAENMVTSYTYSISGQVSKTVEFATQKVLTGPPSVGAMDIWAAGQSGNSTNRVTRSYYDIRGERIYAVDGEGYVTKYDYDANGRTTRVYRYDSALTLTDADTSNSIAAALVSVVYSDSRQTYDGLGRVTDSYDGAGVRTHYIYTGTGELLSTTVANGTSDAAKTMYSYNLAGRLTMIYVGNGTPEAATTSYSYDGLGNIVTVTDPSDNVSYFYYDKLGQQTVARDAEGYVTETAYNAFGEVISITRRANRATNSPTVLALPLYTADAANDATVYSYYDRLGRVIATRDAENYVTQTTYTPFGDIATVTRRANPATNAASASTLPAYTADALHDATTSFVYDRLGRVTMTTDAEGGYEQYTLDAFGNRATVRNKLGGVVINSYDRRGLLTKEVLPISSVAYNTYVEATSVSNIFQYDARGNRTQMVEAAGLTEQRITTYAYDRNDHLVTTTGSAVPIGPSGTLAVPVTTIIYDKRGNVIQVIDPAGASTWNYFDKLDRKIAMIDSLGYMTSWTYDHSSDVLTMRAYSSAVALPTTPGGGVPAAVNPTSYRQTAYRYDRINRLLSTTITGILVGQDAAPYTTSTRDLVTSNVYNALGKIILTTDARSGPSYFYYDRLGRQTAQVDQLGYRTDWTLDSDGNSLSETRYANLAAGYSATSKGSVVANSGNDRTTIFTYDENGRRLTESRQNVVAWTVNATTGALSQATATATIAYTYNALGEVLTKKEATGDRATYTYDLGGRVESEAHQGFADYANPSVTDTPTAHYSYDGLNNVTRVQQGGASSNFLEGRITRYFYDAGGRLAGTADAKVPLTVFAPNRTYTYDIAGRKIGESYTRIKSDGSSVAEGIAYTYDKLGQLTKQTFNAVSGTTWTPVGDSTGIAYNAFGEVTARGINGLWQQSYAYDSAGRVWRATADDGTTQLYLYDATGNQTLAISSSGTDLSADSITAAIARLTNNGANAVGAAAVAGVVATITSYDARGQATRTSLPYREVAAGTTTTMVGSQTYNAFGEVTRTTDARGGTIDYSYNTEGKITQSQGPSVDATDEHGTITTGVRAVQTNYYDLSGRLVGVRDANNNLNTLSLLAGTGYGGGEAETVVEFHADGGQLKRGYDVFGDMRTLTNEIGTVETYTYDSLDRLVEQDHQVRAAGSVGNATSGDVQLKDYYVYDVLGQRTQHWNSQLGSGVKERIDYDAQGRVVAMVDLGGDTTSYAYGWSSGIATAGLGSFGGWTKTTVNAAGLTATEQLDLFGRTTAKTDFGGHAFAYTFDAAGRQVKAVDSGSGLAVPGDSRTTWYNTGLVASVTDGTDSGATFASRAVSTYSYDANGNRTYEGYVVAGVSKQAATVTWDAADRMTGFADSGDSGTDPVSIAYEYDLNSNVRRVNASYRALDDQGNISSLTTTRDSWYRYDGMNRVTTSMGGFVGSRGSGSIVRGAGKDLQYDKAGNRVSALSSSYEMLAVYNPNYHESAYGDPSEQYLPFYYTRDVREDYSYTADGYLARVDIAEGSAYDNGDGTATVVAPAPVGWKRAAYVRDAMGRATTYSEYQAGATAASYTRSDTFNARSQVTAETVVSIGADTYVSSTTNDYNAESSANVWTGAYQGGNLTHSRTTTTRNNALQSTADTRNGYVWWDGARQASIGIVTDNVATTDTNYTTTYTYDALGHLGSVYIGDGRSRTVTFVTNAEGTIIQRDEADGNTATGDPREIYYHVDGMRVGDVSNNGTSDTDYAQSIAEHGRLQGTGPFRGGATYGSAYADFDQNYDPINGLDQDANGGRYTVQAGDTLQSIAQALWGDASLWYKLADANGLDGSETLSPGRDLSVPTNVTASHNTSATYRVYDPNQAIGNVSPTTPKPQAAAHKSHCGAFGQILLVAIAVAVTIVTHGAATNLAASILGGATTATSASAVVLGGALSGVAGSVASQTVGVATGIQDKLDFKGVALAGIGGAIGGALGGGGLFGKAGAFGNIGSPAVGDILRGALGSAAAQGIGVATGLQGRFDWAGVAAAGIGAGVGGAIGGHTDLGRAGAGLAGGLAGAAATSLVSGSDFGDTLLSQLPSIIGNTIGSLVAARIAGNGGGPAAATGGAGAEATPDGGGFLHVSIDTSDPRFAIGGIAAAQSDIGGAAAAIDYVSQAQYDEAVLLASSPISAGSIITADVRDGPDTGNDQRLTVASNRESAYQIALGGVGYNRQLADGTVAFVRLEIADQQLTEFDQEFAQLALTGPKAALGMVGEVPNALITAYDYGRGSISGTEATLNLIPLARVFGGAGRLAAERTAVGGAADLPSGSFSISDWSGYPAGVPRPQGPFRIVEGAEYNAARDAANNANRAIRREQGLVGQPVDVHEIQPVKFGGSPTDPANKVVLPRDVHRQQVTPWWNQFQRDIGH